MQHRIQPILKFKKPNSEMIRKLATTIFILLPILGVCLSYNPSYGQQSPPPISEDSLALEAVIDSFMRIGYEKGLFPGANVTIYHEDSLHHMSHGLAKIDKEVPIHEKTKFQLGSLGKLLTAISVLQQVEKGNLELHAPISEYIAIEDDNKNKSSSLTLHCLLTHTCGFNDLNIGYLAKDQAGVRPLKEFVLASNPGLFQEAGTDIVYSNYSYALAGLIVQEISGSNFPEYVNEHIFSPLGMLNSSLEFPYGYQDDSEYANGYIKKDDGFEETNIHPRHALPAGSLVSIPHDMGLFIKALFTRDVRILSQPGWEMFFQRQFANHPLLNGYTYGLEEQNVNDVSSFAKGGMLPGILSHILIIPNRFAIFSVVNTSEDSFGEFFYKALFDQFFPFQGSFQEQIAGIDVAKYTGEYRNKRYNRQTEENIISLYQGQFNLYANDNRDTLLAYHNGTWHAYVPIEKDVFQHTDLPYEYLYFKLDEKGHPVILYRNLNIGGLSLPSSYEKTAWYNSPGFINEYYGFVPLIIGTGALFIIFALFIRLIRHWKKAFFQSQLLPAKFLILFGVTVAGYFLHTFLGPLQLIRNSQEFLFGYPDSFLIARYIGYALLPLTLALGIYILQLFRQKSGKQTSRIYVSLVLLAMIIHLGFLKYWNFI